MPEDETTHGHARRGFSMGIYRRVNPPVKHAGCSCAFEMGCIGPTRTTTYGAAPARSVDHLAPLVDRGATAQLPMIYTFKMPQRVGRPLFHRERHTHIAADFG